ncbi:hypothetical protein VTO73DRAFT_10347 [Trametes versicolor]
MADADTSTTEQRFTMPRHDSAAQARSMEGIAATTLPLFESGDASSKRTSTLLGDLETPPPSPKRMKHEARSPGGTTESLDSAAQRVSSTGGASTRPHSAAGQYTEGAHAARPGSTHVAAHEVGELLNLFADDTYNYLDLCETVESCLVYDIPADLDSDGFIKLLVVLETPLIYTNALPTPNVALSLVRAARSLSCDVVLKLARKHLCAIWNAEHPPKAFPPPATLDTSTKTSSLLADTAAVHPYPDAVFIILFARQYDLPELLKRAFYELLQIRLTEHNLLHLYNTRFTVQQRWRKAVVLAPYMDEKCVSYYHRYSSKSQHWRKMMLESEVVEAGMGGRLRYDSSSGLTKEQKEAWCRSCCKGWTVMLAVKRREWWANFGELMQHASSKCAAAVADGGTRLR